jgi:hypothetical protein
LKNAPCLLVCCIRKLMVGERVFLLVVFEKGLGAGFPCPAH